MGKGEGSGRRCILAVLEFLGIFWAGWVGVMGIEGHGIPFVWFGWGV